MSPLLLVSLLAVAAGSVALALALALRREGHRRLLAERALAELRAAAELRPELQADGHLAVERRARPNPAEQDEALGPLAREIGHAFNNQLAIISTTTEVLLMELGKPGGPSDDERLRVSLQHVHAASRRCAGFAQRLLAAGRRVTAGSGSPSEGAWAAPEHGDAEASGRDA